MLSLVELRQAVRGRLSEEQLTRVRSVREHGGAALRSALHHPAPLVDKGRDFAAEAGAMLSRLSRRYGTLSAPERERVARDLIASISLESRRWRELLEEPFVGALLDSELYAYALGSARFATNDVEGAWEVLSANLERHPTTLAFLCAAGCSSSGRGDDETASGLLDRGARLFPHDVGLVQAAAVTYYRLGHTARANELLGSVHSPLTELMSGSFANVDDLEREIGAALASGAKTRPKGALQDRYNEALAEDYWTNLFWAMTAYGRHEHRWAWLNLFYQERFAAILRAPGRDLRTFVNFGVFCAEPDRRTAERFGDVQFVGVDREQSTKDLNERAFHAPNLRFEAAEILDVLPGTVEASEGETVLFHGRTTTLMYPAAVQELYLRCADLGVKYVALFENWALSRSRLRYFDPGELPQDAIAFLEVMLVHDYVRYLRDAGYEVIECEYPPYGDLVHEAKYAGDTHIFLVAELQA